MDLEIRNLSKTFANGVVALKNVSLDIQTGMFGLLGPNGAGKTTLMRIVATLLEADKGNIHFGDINVRKEKIRLKKVMSYLPQEFGFYPKTNAVSLLDHFARLKGIQDRKDRKQIVEFLLTRVNLWDTRKQKLGSYSGGMKQRLGIAQVLIGNPELIIVDEPTAGLDPAERNRFHNLLSEIGEDIVVILSTHIVEDVSVLCSNMAIIDKGEILLTEKPLNILSALKEKIWEREIKKTELSGYEAKYKVVSTKLFAGKTIVRIHSKENPGNEFSISQPTLEDGYFYHLSRN